MLLKSHGFIYTGMNMELILWRHADAEEGFPDGSRKLTAKGMQQAQRMADWLTPRLPMDARVLVSPATRAQQTARALTENFKTLREIDVGVDATAVLAAAGWPDADGAVVIVGHQPTLGRVAALLLAGTESDWAVKKGGVWWFSNKLRHGETETVLRVVMSPEFLLKQ
jgi:phosphohistidine phosphatase